MTTDTWIHRMGSGQRNKATRLEIKCNKAAWSESPFVPCVMSVSHCFIVCLSGREVDSFSAEKHLLD